MKILIVDDEQYIRKGLTSLIEWRECGVDSIETASSGEEALDAIRTYMPEIVISDIRMEDLSGIELMKIVLQLGYGTRFIFISGYDEFSYCQQALELGADDYILKPIDFDKLKDAVKKSVGKIAENTHKAIMIEFAENNIKFVREKHLNDLVTGFLNANDLMDGVLFKESDFRKGYYLIVILKIINNSKNEGFESLKKENEDSKAARDRLIDVISSNDIDTECIRDNRNRIVFIFHTNRIEFLNKDFETRLENKFKDAFKELQLSFVAGMGKPVNELENMSVSYFQAERALKEEKYHGYNHVIQYSEGFDNSTFVFDNATFTDRLIEGINKNNHEETIAYTNNLFSSIPNNEESFVHAKFIAFSMLNVINKYFSEADQYFKHYREIENLKTMPDIITYVINTYNEIYEINGTKPSKSIIRKIKKYINDFYYEDLTLNRISKLFYINPNYFSEFFKKENGISFNKYLTYVRIEMAKKYLLESKDLSIAEIAEKTGYSDSKYFSQVFRLMTQQSPSGFRK